MCAALVSFVGEERQVSTASSKEEGHNIGVITYILKGLIFIILMSISCAYECEDKYKVDIEDCHYIYEAETVASIDNHCLILCIRDSENKLQNCLK